LPHAGGAHEDEGADRPLGILEPSSGTPNGLRDDVDRLLLADDALVQRILHVEQAIRLLGADADHGDPRPHADDLGDLLLGHDRDVLGRFLVPRGTQGVDLLLALRLLVAQAGGSLVVLGGDRLVLLAGDLLEAALRLLDVGRRLRLAQPHARPGLVHQVDRLIGQRAVGHVADREVNRGADRLVADLDVVVVLVAGPDPEQDLKPPRRPSAPRP